MSKNNYFPEEIFCINLKERKDKWLLTKKAIESEGFRIKRIEAIKNEKFPHIGCTISHKKTLCLGIKKDYPFMIVFEDDIEIRHKQKFKEKIIKIMSKLPDDWDILYLGGFVGRGSRIEKINTSISRVTHFMCTYALVYNKKSYKKIISQIPNYIRGKEHDININGFKTYDEWLANIFQKNNKCYVANELLVSERPSFSDIEKRNKNTKIKYLLRFWIYKNHLGKILDIGGKIGDFLHISSRYKNRKSNRTSE